MVEMIERKMKIDKKEIDRTEYPHFQVSYNSDGHIVLRFFNNDFPDNDIVIVFNRYESITLMDFIKYKINR